MLPKEEPYQEDRGVVEEPETSRREGSRIIGWELGIEEGSGLCESHFRLKLDFSGLGINRKLASKGQIILRRSRERVLVQVAETLSAGYKHDCSDAEGSNCGEDDVAYSDRDNDAESEGHVVDDVNGLPRIK